MSYHEDNFLRERLPNHVFVEKAPSKMVIICAVHLKNNE